MGHVSQMSEHSVTERVQQQKLKILLTGGDRMYIWNNFISKVWILASPFEIQMGHIH